MEQLIHNKKRKFPGIFLQYGTSGILFSSSTQSSQAPINIASTFDRDLMYKVGAAQAKEFKYFKKYIRRKSMENLWRRSFIMW